jgi:MraZ protein
MPCRWNGFPQHRGETTVDESGSVFLGQFHRPVGEQGRCSLPAPLRHHVSSGLVVTRGLDKCLLLFPRETWQQLLARVSGLPVTLRQARLLRRLLFSGAVECPTGDEGCIELPQELCTYAEIRGQVVIVGLGSYLELWSPACWGEALDSLEAEAESLADGLDI